MKYFTPERIVAYGSEDETTWAAADLAWEEQIAAYDSYLDGVKHLYSPGLKHIESSYYLHDANIHGIGVTQGQIVFYLQLDTPPQSLLTFRYDLVEPPRIDRDVLPEHHRDKSVIKQWMYDELELVEGDPPTWRQSILLSNGWEVTLHFRDVLVEEIEAILPAPRQSSFSAPADLPQTA